MTSIGIRPNPGAGEYLPVNGAPLRRTTAVWLICVVVACGRDDDSTRSNAAPDDPLSNATFVGSGTCATCHPAEFARWRGSHHDLAMQEPAAESILGDFSGTEFVHPGARWTFTRQEGAWIARVETPDGEIEEHEIAFVFGVDPLQQYLVEFPGGRYQVLPVAWDSRPAAQGGRRWFDVQPDEVIARDDPLHWTGPNLTWNYMCAECHSTGLRKNYSPASDVYATEWSELDVACEACHGPGSEHARWAATADVAASSSGADRAVVDPGLRVRFDRHDPGEWIIDPVTGSARPLEGPDDDAQLDVCGRCHSRRGPISAAYRHGAPLLDTHRPSLLVEGLYFADGQIRDEVYVWGSFVQSAMYRAGVTCNDCHDPHSLELRGEGNGVCLRCHAVSSFDDASHHFHPEGTESARCVSCHMMSRTYMVVDPRRDHSFRVPDPEAAAAVGAPDPCTSCHADMTAIEAAATIAERSDGPARRRTSYHASAIFAARTGDPSSLPGLYSLFADPAAPSITRATALTLLGNDLNPRRVTVVRQGLSDTDPLIRLGALEGIRQAPTGELVAYATSLLQDPVRVVRIAAAEVVAPFADQPVFAGRPLGSSLRSALASGLDEFREAQLTNQERPEAQLSLAWLAALGGENLEAEHALRRAIEIAPTFVPAWVNLADLYYRTGRDADGEPLLRSALDIVPGDAALHHALGLLLVRMGRTGEAMESLRQAVELGGRDSRYAYVYGVALQSSGDTAAARLVFEDALALHPRDRDLLFALAVLHRDGGRKAEALRHARALAEAHPFDPAGPALLSELGG